MSKKEHQNQAYQALTSLLKEFELAFYLSPELTPKQVQTLNKSIEKIFAN